MGYLYIRNAPNHLHTNEESALVQEFRLNYVNEFMKVYRLIS